MNIMGQLTLSFPIIIGSYATLPGSTACTGQEVIACPAGSGVLSDQLGCYLCPINTYNTGSSSQCKSCPTGSVGTSLLTLIYWLMLPLTHADCFVCRLHLVCRTPLLCRFILYHKNIGGMSALSRGNLRHYVR